jgi:hypothetical protein
MLGSEKQFETETEVVRGETVRVAQGTIGTGNVHLVCEKATINLDLEALERHLLFLGAIGSGKTNAIFQLVKEIRRLMTDNDVMVIFDTKGDYVKEFYRDGDAVISNREDWSYNYVHWNIFRDMRFRAPRNIVEPVNEISRTLYDEFTKKTKDIFFPHAARDITTAVFVSLLRQFFLSLRTKKANEPTNSEIRKYLYNSGPQELRSLIEGSADLRGALQYIESDESRQTQGVLSTVKIMVQDLFSGSFGEPGNFSVRQFVQEKGGRVLFIEYDISSGRTLLPIYRVLFDLAMKEALARRRSEGNVYFTIDEFALLPNLYHIENAVNFGRSLGVKCVVGSQNVAQVIAAYGKSRASSILSSFGTVFAFRMFDHDSRASLSERYGTNRQKIITTNYAAGSRTTVEQFINGKAVEDWHISSLATGEAIACFFTGPPYFLKFNKYSSSIRSTAERSRRFELKS